MSNLPQPSRTRRFYIAWIAAIIVCATFFLWTHSVLSPEHPAPPMRAELEKPVPKKLETPAPSRALKPFAPDSDEYIITAFSLQGMRHVTDAEPAFTLLPPGNTLVAQVIKRDPSPEPQFPGKGGEAATVSYTLDQKPDPAAGRALPLDGILGGSEDSPWFVNESIPVMPYLARTGDTASGSGFFYPYPTATLSAADNSGQVLMETRAVLPVSTEIGCRRCHSGPWKYEDAAGISRQTADNIFAVHDRRSHTNFAEQAAQNKTVDCRSCHSGAGEQPNISTAIHGFHAGMKLDGQEGCGACHASADEGATRFNRDFHATIGLDCTRCHGSMAQHALSLLRFETERGSTAASARKVLLEVEYSLDANEINPRKPWVNLPQCAGCHDFSKKPDPGSASAFNKWTQNKNERFSYAVENTGKLRCPSCHGSPHALYPTYGPSAEDDNLQPLLYQKKAAPLGKNGNCSVCHSVDMDGFIHHDLVEQ